jgi:uncharacterized protein YcbK (DUF882 family)
MMPRNRADALAIALFASLTAAVIWAKITALRAVPPVEQHAVLDAEQDAVPRAADAVLFIDQDAVVATDDRLEVAVTATAAATTAVAPVTTRAAAPVTTTAALAPASPPAMTETPQATTSDSEQTSIFARYKQSLIRPAHDRVVMQYTPPMLRTLLARAAEYFQAPVLVTSAYRSPGYNRRVGGVRRSMHMVRDGRRGAVDFKVVGVSKTTLYAWAKRQPEVNGIGLYCRSDFIHVDNGHKRSWYWGCGRTRYAKRHKVRVADAVARPSGSDH